MLSHVLEVRKQYTYDRAAVTRDTGVVFPAVGRTLQSQKQEADINFIMQRFGVTGMAPTNIRVPLASDFGNMDFQSAMNAIVQARKSFDALDADVRYRFRNDPGLFVEFCQDPKNLDEMRKMGLAVPAKKVVDTPPMRVIIEPSPIVEAKK